MSVSEGVLPLRVANFMDSSLYDLEKKGVLGGAAETYNPEGAFEVVYHFTPHEQDLSLASEFIDHHIHLIHHPAGWISIRRIFRSMRQVTRLIRTERINLVRGRLPYLGSLVGAIAARLRGVPFVVSLGGDNRIGQRRSGEYYYGSKTISYAMEWLVLKLASAVIVPNRYTLAYVGQVAGPKTVSRCEVIPWLSPPVPTEAPDDDERLARLELSQTRPIILIVGFLNPYKFTDILFQMLEDEESREFGPVDFYFCGDGPLKVEGERRFAEREGIKFLGWQQRETIHALMRRAEIVLIPMSGFVLLEAASLGKAVVTSNLEWHSEIVSHEFTGLLVDPVNASEWRDAIVRLLAKSELRDTFGNALKARYESDYLLRTAIDKERALYHELVHARQ